MDYNLYSKIKLRFKNGKFKILMISDIQETLDFNEKSYKSIDALIEKVNPDFIMLGGDNCNGNIISNTKELSEYLEILAPVFEKRNIPWAHIFGNHDHDIKSDDLENTLLYEAYPHCVSKHTEGIYGTTNFVLPIFSSDESRIAFNLWGLDSNNEIKDYGIDYEGCLENYKRYDLSRNFDIIHFDQLMWYWNTSKEFEKLNSSPVDGLVFVHVPLWEAQYIIDNPELTGGKGSMIEPLGIGAFNSGAFSAFHQRGDIRCIASGHAHCDCFEGDLFGIKICLDGSAGYSSYGDDNVRGGRVFELDENDTKNIKTYMIHYKDL